MPEGVLGVGRQPMTRAKRWMAGALTLVALSCTREPSDSARMRPLVEPHLTAFARYDRWARRVETANSAFRSDEALEEAAFAPLRRQRDVAAAWLVREGLEARTLSHPSTAPPLPEDGWVRLLTESLGEIHTQQRRLIVGERETLFILVRRTRAATDGTALHVAMAFAAPPPDEP